MTGAEKGRKKAEKTHQEAQALTKPADKGGKGAEKGGKKGGKSGVPPTPKTHKITPKEKEYLRLISEGIINPKSLAICLKCKKSVVYEHLKELRKKGLIDRYGNMAEKFEGTIQLPEKVEVNPRLQHSEGGAPKHQITLHGVQFHAEILYMDERYKPKINSTIYIDGNTIICNREVIQVHVVKRFVGEDENKAMAECMAYSTPLLYRIQNDLKIILIKNRAQNIKIVRLKYSETNNEIVRDAEISGERIRLYTNEDGKLWFDMDESWNLQEMHLLHPETAQDDTRKCVKQLTDWRTNDPPTMTEIFHALIKTENNNAITTENLKEISSALGILTHKQKEPEIKTTLDKDDYYHIYG